MRNFDATKYLSVKMTQMMNICPWRNTSGYILCAWDSGLTAREQADAPKGAVGDDLPALSGALVVRSIPLYILRSPL